MRPRSLQEYLSSVFSRTLILHESRKGKGREGEGIVGAIDHVARRALIRFQLDLQATRLFALSFYRNDDLWNRVIDYYERARYFASRRYQRPRQLSETVASDVKKSTVDVDRSFVPGRKSRSA